MKQKNLLIIIIFSLAAISSSAQSKTEVLTNKSVIDLVKAGLSKDLIASKISSSTCKFDISTNGLIDMKKQGVSDELVQAIMDKANNKSVVAQSSSVTSPKKETSNSTDALSGATLLNQVYVYNKGKESVQPLEKSLAFIRAKQGMFGGSIVLDVDGEKSAYRLISDNTTSFVINTGLASTPELILYKVPKPTKKLREVTVMKANSSGSKGGSTTFTLNIIKLKDGIYQVSVGTTLDKGEYFFTGKPGPSDTKLDAFTFGID